MSKATRFRIKFVGYSAEIVGLKKEHEVRYASIDFVTGHIIMIANQGCVVVQKRANLRPFVASLPEHVHQLQGSWAREWHDLEDDKIKIDPGANPNRVIRQIARRFSEIEQCLEQVENFGAQIKRRPYQDYIDEIEKTDRCRVEIHGFGLFQDGALSFHGDYHTVLIRVCGRTGAIEEIDDGASTTLTLDLPE
jgi:hypothetical protein